MITRKIMLLGEIGVGKTSIAQRLVFDRFAGSYKPTIGTDVYRYELAPPPSGQPFQFLVFDTDGNFGTSIFREVSIRQAVAAMIVGDVSRGRTLESMVQLAEGFADAFPGRYVGYVLNKIDLTNSGVLELLPAKLEQPEFPVFRTSAKTGDHVRTAFHEAAATILRRGL